MWTWIKRALLLTAAAVLGAGLYIGNLAYERLLDSPWDQILGIRNETGELSRLHEAERRYGWEAVEVTSRDGTVLSGTYAESERPSHRTVILLHGLYSNRSMCLPLLPLYREMGFNVLMVDLRGHGESGGRHTMWGMREMDDLDAWMAWLGKKDPAGGVGIHGISLGGAMAILYGGTGRGASLLFCVSDSAYADLLSLGKEKLYAWTGDDRLLYGMDLIDPFFQAAMFFHTGKWLRDIEPVRAAEMMRAPLLLLHGADDRLVPPDAAEALGRAAGSSRKEIRIFQGAGHAGELAANPEAYRRIVEDFVRRS